MASEKPTYTVGIVGAGMAGLYAAHLLHIKQEHSNIKINVHLYELAGKVGGRVNTYHFTPERDQYYEAGAMRIPRTDMHQPVIELIHYLNDNHNAKLRIIDYKLNDGGNIIFVNGNHTYVSIESEQTAEALGFDVPEEYRKKTAGELLFDAIGGIIKLLNDNFEEGWKYLLKYDRYTFRRYLEDVVMWPPSVVGFVETLCSQTNQYTLSFPELIMQNLDFNVEKWTTLEDGMDTLPQALANVIKLENITFGARVQGIEVLRDGKVEIHADTTRGPVKVPYDKVILAIPPSAVRMIPKRPRWSPKKEEAIRSIYFEPLYKIGLRFKTRFWEKVKKPSYGGQSITDLPIRWIVYPSYGLESDGPGVLLLYSWMWDASLWSSVPFSERVKTSLQHLAEVYKGRVDVHDQFISANDMPWAENNPTGDCMFLPGQFSDHFENAKKPEGNIYFAGEHLSRHHTWISGALDSGRIAAHDVFKDLRPEPVGFDGWIPRKGGPPNEDYDPGSFRKELIKNKVQLIYRDFEKFERHFLRNNSGGTNTQQQSR